MDFYISDDTFWKIKGVKGLIDSSYTLLQIFGTVQNTFPFAKEQKRLCL
jgi:hypothetical protein